MADGFGFYGVLGPMALVAGFVRGFAGFGGPLILLPILNVYLPPTASVPVVMWVDLFVNVRLLPEGLRQAAMSVVVPLTIGTVAAMPVGLVFLVGADAYLMKRCISAAILVAALVLLSGWRYRGAIGRAGWTGVGLLAGFIMGATSLAVSAALFLHAGSQTAMEARANFIVWVFFVTIALLAMLAVSVGLATPLIWVITLLAPLYVIGSAIGSRVNRNAPEAVVRRAVLLLVVVVALAGLAL